jgi:hypothetical protein
MMRSTHPLISLSLTLVLSGGALISLSLTLVLSGGGCGHASSGSAPDDNLSGMVSRDGDENDMDVSSEGGLEEATSDPSSSPQIDLFAGCSTRWRYDPERGDELYAFPDDYYRVSGSEERAAYIRIDEERAPWISRVPRFTTRSFSTFEMIDGYGLNAGIFLRFTHPISPPPEGGEASLSADRLMLVAFTDSGVRRIPYQARLGDEGHDLYMRPLRPLDSGAQHAVVMTDAYLDAEGGCVRPSASFEEMLKMGADSRIATGLDLLSTHMELDQRSIVAMLPFTTHTKLDLMAEVAQDIQRHDYQWLTPPSCQSEERWIRCDGLFEAFDYRAPKVVLSPTPQSTWSLPVTVWMPIERSDPAPVIIGGHGINSDREQLTELVAQMVPLGYAVIAVDAVEHGDHPSRDPDATDLDALRILGISLEETQIDMNALRGHFNQTTFDRLQLIELIRGAPDVDQDAIPDLDIEQLGYFGISLGALMGPSLIALSDEIEIAVLAVGGGDLVEFALGNPTVQPLLPILAQIAGSRGHLDRAILTLQSLLDPADPNTFASRVLQRRLNDVSLPPHVLLFVSPYDETVPPQNGHSLARALRLPHIPAVVDPVELLEVESQSPIIGNIVEGVTAGFFQLDRVTVGDQRVRSDHDNAPYSPEAIYQYVHFFESWRAGGVAELIDPYDLLSTP